MARGRGGDWCANRDVREEEEDMAVGVVTTPWEDGGWRSGSEPSSEVRRAALPAIPTAPWGRPWEEGEGGVRRAGPKPPPTCRGPCTGLGSCWVIRRRGAMHTTVSPRAPPPPVL